MRRAILLAMLVLAALSLPRGVRADLPPKDPCEASDPCELDGGDPGRCSANRSCEPLGEGC